MRQNFIVYPVIQSINIAVVELVKAVAETVVKASMRVAAVQIIMCHFVM